MDSQVMVALALSLVGGLSTSLGQLPRRPCCLVWLLLLSYYLFVHILSSRARMN